MIITKGMSIGELQSKFQERFPHLKIELYKQAHDFEQGSPKKDQFFDEQELKELSKQLYPAEILLTPSMSARLIEEIFEDLFSLHVQVFRKSGKNWIQTIKTDSWTLGELEQSAKATV